MGEALALVTIFRLQLFLTTWAGRALADEKLPFLGSRKTLPLMRTLPKIGHCAAVLHQIRNFAKRAPRGARREARFMGQLRFVSYSACLLSGFCGLRC